MTSPLDRFCLTRRAQPPQFLNAPASGRPNMSDNEADAWADSLRRDSEAGVFFGSSNYYAVENQKIVG